MLNFGLRDSVICVTGGGSGIGRACVMALVKDGARVGVLDRDAAAVSSAVDEATRSGGQAFGMTSDVTDASAMQKCLDQLEDRLGPLFGLVAAAGTSGAARAEALAIEDWERIMSVNVTGIFQTCQVFGNRMLARGAGSIVTIGSLDGLGGHPGRTHYVASKHAVSGITKNLALEWGRRGVRVNCVAPSFVDTPLLRRGMPAQFIKEIAENRIPLGRIANTGDVANAVLMFLSDATSYLTGVILPVDGGLTAGYFTNRNGADLSSQRLLDAGDYSES